MSVTPLGIVCDSCGTLIYQTDTCFALLDDDGKETHHHVRCHLEPNEAGNAINAVMRNFVDEDTAQKWHEAINAAYGREGTE